MKNYFIKDNYVSRTEYVHYNDQQEEDNWQLEIYLHALGLMKKNKLQKVVDLGCGSAYKLVTYFDEYKTIGLEIKENLDFLRNKYPEKEWLESNFSLNHNLDTDVLICSDVIEHIVNPNDLIEYIKKISFKYLILSTPERDLVYEKDSRFLDGPPRNPAHQREWNYDEFNKYISEHFEVIEHRITNLHQSTQMIICVKK